MVLAAADIFAGDVTRALEPALGVEVFHNFTLLHDDIMDNAVVRRGLPTVHVKWDANTAILSGDAMMILANQLVMQAPAGVLTQVLGCFNDTALSVCEGQQYDMNLEHRSFIDGQVTEQEYMDMIRLKTSVLIGASLKIGALCGGASARDADTLYEYGTNIGLAFQVQDDLLDTFGEAASFGKRIGGDIVEGKKTYLLVKLMERASDEDKQAVVSILTSEGMEHEAKIRIIKELYVKYAIPDMAEQLINQLFERAKQSVLSLSVDDKRRAILSELESVILGRVS
jgi:geranylgeranyl diphosphate synthase type II